MAGYFVLHTKWHTLDRLGKYQQGAQAAVAEFGGKFLVYDVRPEVVEGESRNMLQESARIARGEIVPLSEIFAADYDALIFPGGFGAAKNLCDFAVAGADAVAHPQVKSAICNFLDNAKVLGFICIAPTIAASALRDHHAVVELTVGNCPDTHVALNEMGAKTIDCDYTQIHVDTQNKIVSTPAYMLADNINQLAVGIDALVSKVVDMCNE
jgi:enhancing lycopene biosynthesis protein 2